MLYIHHATTMIQALDRLSGCFGVEGMYNISNYHNQCIILLALLGRQATSLLFYLVLYTWILNCFIFCGIFSVFDGSKMIIWDCYSIKPLAGVIHVLWNSCDSRCVLWPENLWNGFTPKYITGRCWVMNYHNFLLTMVITLELAMFYFGVKFES